MLVGKAGDFRAAAAAVSPGDLQKKNEREGRKKKALCIRAVRCPLIPFCYADPADTESRAASIT